jgi:hypothetical protein
MAMLFSNIEQMHKEIALINNLLLEEHRENSPAPLQGLTSGKSSVRLPQLPTPLREMQPAFRDASVEVDRNASKGHARQPSDSYFPNVGMDGYPTIPPQRDASRNKPALSSAKSEADLRGTRPQSPTHPALRPAVAGQSRFPHFSKLKLNNNNNYKEV